MRWLLIAFVVAGCSSLPPKEALRRAEENSRRGRLDAAAKFYEEAADKLKGTERERALLSAARAYYEAGLWRKAFGVYQTLFDETADKSIKEESLRRMFEIAAAFVEGRAEPSWLGVNVGWQDWGAERLAELAERFPCLPQAQRAWILVGRYWLGEKDYGEAEKWFGKVLREAADVEVRQAALFYLAECCIGQVRGVDYDAGLLERARKFLRLYLARGGAQAKKARERLAWVQEMLAKRELKIARFYINQGRAEASKPHLRYLIKEFPDTKAAEEGRRLLVEMGK